MLIKNFTVLLFNHVQYIWLFFSFIFVFRLAKQGPIFIYMYMAFDVFMRRRWSKQINMYITGC